MSFVDTNVLVHAATIGSPDHHRAWAALARLPAARPVVVTRQVLREYLSAVNGALVVRRCFGRPPSLTPD